MNILITVTYYSPYISGLTLAVRNLAELLASKNYKVTILTSQHDKKLPMKQKSRQVMIRRMPFFAKVSKGFLYTNILSEAINTIKWNDVIIINLPQVEGFFYAIIAKILRKRIIAYYHCNVTLTGGFLAAMITKTLLMANDVCLRLSDSIISTSDDFAMHDVLLMKYKKKLHSAYPVIEHMEADQIRKRIIKENLGMKKKYVIGFVGRLAREKGIEYLIGAIPFLKEKFGTNFSIYIVGSSTAVGEHEYVKEITNLMNKNTDVMKYVGLLSSEDLPGFYANLDVLVIPSINSTEAFGMVQVEAMQMGIPVVVTNLPGVRVPVQKTGMGEIVARKDSKELADAIIKILINPLAYKKKREIVVEEFSHDKIADTFSKEFIVS